MNACLRPHSSLPQSTPHPSLAQTIMGQELPQPHPYFPSISYFLATQQHPALVFLHNIVLHYSPLRLSNQKHPLIASAQEFGARFIVLYTIVFTKQVHAISSITLHGQYTFCTTKQLNYLITIVCYKQGCLCSALHVQANLPSKFQPHQGKQRNRNNCYRLQFGEDC